MLKLGVRAHDFGRKTPRALAETVAEAGFEAVQLALTKAISGVAAFEDVTLPLLEETRRAFADNRVEIAVLGCYIEPALGDREARLAQVEKFLLGLRHANELGVSLVGTETTRFSTAPEAEPRREEAYGNLLDSVLRMAEEAERLGVCIGIEPVAGHTLNTAALTRRLLDEVKSPRLRVIFDPVNLILADTASRQEEVYRDFLEKVGAEIAAVHVKDIVFEAGEEIWRNIGSGIVRYGEISAWLQSVPRDLALLREDAVPGSAGEDIAAMRRIFSL